MVLAKLKDRRTVVLKRCSSNAQAGTSIPNQTTSVESLIAENRITVVKEFDLAGVTGSIPGARSDIDEIIALKRSGLDFDLLLLPNTDRFTRAGQFHGIRLLDDLENEGITVYFAAEGLFSDERLARQFLSFLFDAAQQHAIAISRGATLGTTNSFLEARSSCGRRQPFGMDRMYSLDGKDLYIIRNLADGTQQMLHPTTGQLIRTFGKNQKGGVPAHYIKQKNEHVRNIPGDSKRVAVVHLMMHLVYIEGEAYNSTARRLNDEGIASATGTEWSARTVKAVVTNPAYIGRLINGRSTQAIYYKTARGAPAESDVKPHELKTRRRPRLRKRPVEDWLERRDPVLAEFLPQPVRDIAKAAIEAHLLEEGKAEQRPPRSKDRHRNSDFILKNVLRSKQGNYPMTGRRQGRNGKYRAYAVARGSSYPKTNNVLASTVPAPSLEQAMLGVLREVLQSKSDIESSLRCAAERHARQHQRPDDRSKIEKELRRKQRQVAAAIESLTGDDEADRLISEKLANYRSEIARLTSALKSEPPPKKQIDIDSTVARLTDELGAFGQNLDTKEKAIVHEMMKLLIHRMEIDLVTRETDVELALPGSTGAAMNGISMMSLDRLIAWKTSNEAHQENPIILANYRCWAERRRPLCFICRRLQRAA